MNEYQDTWAVAHIVTIARDTLASLRDEHGQIIDGDAELLAALADEGVDVSTVLSRLGRAALDAAADVAAADARIEALRARRDRHLRREAAMRAALQQAMGALGLRKYRDAEFSASRRYGQAKLVITNAAEIPDDLVKESVTRSPLRPEIRAAMDAGRTVPGVLLDNTAPVLTLLTK
jgi:hypothetical protein